MRTLLRTRLRPMGAEDIAQVMDIERESFPAMWPQTAYRRELTNKIARYLVLTEVPDDEPPEPDTGVLATFRRLVGAAPGQPSSGERLLGFIGLWLMVGEAHIVTVAVRGASRRMGIGERLLLAGIDLAVESHQELLTLEVRASNEAAQRLYEKYHFARVGVRRRYYTDNNEDGVIMTTPDLLAPHYQALVAGLREQHRARHPDLWA